MPFPHSALLCATILLSACTGSLPYAADIPGPRPVMLEVLKPVNTEPGWARAFLQHGALQHYGDFSRYHPFCYLELNLVQDRPQTIGPGQFEIRAIRRHYEEVVRNENLRYASLWFVDSDVSDQTQMLVFLLHSEQQPGVRALVCGGAFDAPSRAAAPTPSQIAETLGDYARLRSTAE